MLKAVIFDLDGVIVDTDLLHSRAYEKVLLEHGVDPVKNSYGTVHISGATSHDTWEALKSQYGIETPTAQLVGRKQTALMESLDGDIVALPGALELIRNLHEHGVTIALATSAQRSRAMLILDKLAVSDYFSTIVCAEDVTRGKPNPEVYNVTRQRLGIDQSEIVVIEDAEAGSVAASEANLTVVAVPSKLNKKMDFSTAASVYDSLLDVNYEKLSQIVG